MTARRVAAVVLPVVAAAALAGASIVGVRAATRDTTPTLGKNLLLNRPGPIDANNTPTVARNPRRPDNLVVMHRVDRPGYSAKLLWSLDGGRAWGTTELPLPEGLDRPFAADAAFSPDGTLYVSYVNLTGNGNAPGNLWVTRSTDGGRSLEAPTHLAGKLAFQARIVAGEGETVFVTWLQAAEVGLSLLGRGPHPIVMARSDDGGRTFADPVQVSDPERERVGAASPVIDGRGRLVVLYQDFKDDRRDFQNLDGPPWEGEFALVLAASEDGGRTFDPGVELESGVVPTRRFIVFLPEFPSLAAGRGGRLYVAWTDGRHGDEDVLLRRSGDGGRTWDEAVRVNDNPVGDGTTQYLPKVAVAPGGRVDVLFFDRRRDAVDVMTDVTLASSSDGGRTFANLRLSSHSFDSRVGPSTPPHVGVDFGSRLGLVSGDGPSFAAWTDSRMGDLDTGRQDIVGAGYEIPAPVDRGATAATMAVLLAVAVASFLGWRRLRPRPAATSESRAEGDRDEVAAAQEDSPAPA